MKGVCIFLFCLLACSSAEAGWRIGPRPIFRAPVVRQPVKLVHRPQVLRGAYLIQPRAQSGCRMINGRLVCPNAR